MQTIEQVLAAAWGNIFCVALADRNIAGVADGQTTKETVVRRATVYADLGTAALLQRIKGSDGGLVEHLEKLPK